ncbi:T9SS type B sorting domain-containing protein [Algoriphagus pacificus]|uniref:Gliding motility-associated C-terminal domain-containing protein n=1 Tax=Algoriphagus pacificus TaxID=2811234 RepID=A0ABS3CNC6_9BACT|nr:gliding motility-associated C-terminal domain-containing protein [Algoriphagus pacificus]MBN7817750.1 gliding motility-associated C-terminal domain-containing protein [Algoriphagus pacificus]
MLLAIVSIGLCFSYVIAKNPENRDFSNSKLADPELIGPEKLCMVFGSVIGEFSGGGNPIEDVYSWVIKDASGTKVFSRNGGYPTITYTFSKPGNYSIELQVNRGIEFFPLLKKNISVLNSPESKLNPNYQICGNDPLSLTAIDNSDPETPLFTFEWRDENDQIIGNSNTINISTPGTYSVEYYILNSLGEKDCTRTLTTTIVDSSDFEVLSDQDILCPNQTVNFYSDSGIIGDWYYQKVGTSDKIFIETNSQIIINPNVNLVEPGEYEIILEVTNDDVSGCVNSKSKVLTYYPLPDFTVLTPIASSGCNVLDGKIRIQAITDLDYVYIEGTFYQTPSIKAGEIFEIPSLESGAYNLIAVLGNCINSYASVVPLSNPPSDLEYQLIDDFGESCSETGKLNGGVSLNFINGNQDGYYRVLNEKGGTFTSDSFLNQDTIPISLPGGRFVIEVFNLDSCNVPKKEFIEIPGKDQVSFIIPSELSICQSFDLIPETSEDLEFTLTKPDGSVEIKLAGDGFTLDQAGTHILLGKTRTATDFCPTLKEFNVKLVDPVEFEPRLVQENCFGTRTFEANIFGRDPSTVIFTWYNELDEIVGRGQYLFPTSLGEFKLDVQPANSAACPIPPKTFLIEEPILEVDVTLTSTKLCELGPGAVLNLESTFPDEITDINWRRYDASGAIENLDQFKDLKEITVFDDGVYEASVFSIIPEIGKDCELGRNSIELNFTLDRVEFTIPDSLSICETFDIIPETTQPLLFELTQPDGSIVQKNAGEPFTLDQNGIYSLYGYDPEVSSPNCPEIKEFYVQVNQPIPFEPVLFSEDCNGVKVYQAKLTGATAADANISWYDPNGTLVGTDEFLTLDNVFGTYALEVQPKNSERCDLSPMEFDVPEPIFNVDVSLIAAALCPDAPDAAISIETDFDKVTFIEWWFTDLNGNQTELTNQKNKPEILATQEGTYEARVFNNVPCLIGSDLVLLTRSMDQVRPIVEESYQVCPRYEIAPNINPGDFAAYEWYHEDKLVSTSAAYKPLLVGNFELIVYSAEGCAYSTTFETLEECELKVVFPNAIELDNPDKNFLIYTNYLVDELELWIFNQWGQLIYHCKNTELIDEESTCAWDGTLNGEKIPNGAYSIRVNYRNYAKNINEEYLGSLMVIE